MDSDGGGPAVVRLEVLRVEAGRQWPDRDWVSTEVPVELRFNGQPFAVMMATPADLEDFALGFARSEAGLADLDAVERIRIHEQLEGIVLEISRSDMAVTATPRGLPGNSGCGLCGSRTLEDVVRQPPTVSGRPVLHRFVLEQALALMRQAQTAGRLSGSLHAAGWFSLQGELLLVREDVGRHNALDKLLGALWKQGLAIDEGFLVVTSRASYEMVTKAAAAGVAIMVAISAPTALAVRLADSCGLSLIGFARPGRCLIYTHDFRFK